MHFLMTVDVESFSNPLNREDAEIARLVYEVGLPRLLDLLSKHDVQSTFYFTGMFAEQSLKRLNRKGLRNGNRRNERIP